MATLLLMPALSPTMQQGTLARWCKQEGEEVKPGEVMAEIETDKAIMDFEAVDRGIIAKILIAGGTPNIKVNTPLAVLLEKGEGQQELEQILASIATPQSSDNNMASSDPASKKAQQQSSAGALAALDAVANERIMASPLAKKLAAEHNLDLGDIRGSGPNGRIIRQDVMECAQQKGQTSKSESVATPGLTTTPKICKTGATEITPLSPMRKVIAERLSQAKREIPHFYLSADIEVSSFLKARQQINDHIKKSGQDVRISVTDLLIKVVAMALRDCPEINRSWSDNGLINYSNIDIAVAVAIPNGLITPIVRCADTLSLTEIAIRTKELISKARDNKLTPQEYQGAGFTISNLGMYQVDSFYAIVNPPQSAILAVSRTREAPVVRDGAVVPGQVMTLTVSCDHRVVDGAVAATFLGQIQQYITAPYLMLS